MTIIKLSVVVQAQSCSGLQGEHRTFTGSLPGGARNWAWRSCRRDVVSFVSAPRPGMQSEKPTASPWPGSLSTRHGLCSLI